jgi:hypothetical protein
VGESFIDFQQISISIEMTAIPPATYPEVSFVGPPSIGEETLKRNVINKLHYVLSKKNEK